MRIRFRPLVLLACAVIGFLAVTAAQSRPASPEARLPRQYRLAALIERQQASAAELRREVKELRARVGATTSPGDPVAASARASALRSARVQAGLAEVRGAGLRVTLEDSLLEKSPTGDVNDLVIHSSDVQATVNALWRSGAEAVAINGQRLVSTSAVLCVGNTLLLNGTVHSPPYVMNAIGADRARFEADSLMSRLKRDAAEFGLRVSVRALDSLIAPGYSGATALRYAQPVEG